MKHLKKIAIIFTMLLLVACNSKNKEDHSEHNGKTESYYTCSMHPQIRADKPGNCPICGMKLILVKKVIKEEANEISLSDQQIKLGNITTQSIAETQNSIDQNFTGVLAINQENVNTIATRAMGRIEKLYVKTQGEFVKINQPIYLLYSEDIAIAKQDYKAAYLQLEMPGDFGKNAKNMLNAAKQKLHFLGLTNSQIESLKSSKEISPYTTFYSTYNGYVTEVQTQEGSYVMEGEAVIKLADLNTLWLEAQVNANYLSSIKMGQKAKVSFIDFPNETVNATISFINPEINANTRQLLIRLEIPNSNKILKPGMQAIAKVIQPNIKGIFVPTDAVIRDENASYIWIEKRHGVFENLMIETGIETNGRIEIISEIDTNKKVVITGAYAINSEYKFRKGSNPMEGMKM